MTAPDKPFLNFMQLAFEESLAKAYGSGVDEKVLLDAIEPAYNQARAKAKLSLLRELKRSAPKMLRERRKDIAGFEKRNFARWRKASDRFEMLIVMVEEIGEAHDVEFGPAASENDDYKFAALAHLLPRAVLVAREILHLLKGGYPDAALARWRSLYEMSVIAQFLSQHDSNIAVRYLASFDFRALRAAREYNAHAKRGNLEPFSPEDLAALEQRAADVERHIGERLKKDYDWAHPALAPRFATLKPDKVDFAHIEQSVEMDHWRPRFRWANQHIHGGFRPHGTLLGMCESGEGVALVGPSNSGFVDPFQMGAISLVHVATVFLLTEANLDRIVQIDMLGDVGDEIAEIAIKLEQETLAAHRG